VTMSLAAGTFWTRNTSVPSPPEKHRPFLPLFTQGCNRGLLLSLQLSLADQPWLAALTTSLTVMRPSEPEPSIWERSTPSS
jgi:hypothetical protein